MEHFFIKLDVLSCDETNFTNPFDYVPDQLTLLAVSDLQSYLKSKDDFGLVSARTGKQIGKMFGVLVVQNDKGELGYLRAFSGKLLNANLHETFVPPIYDSLENGGFLSKGMLEISKLGEQIQLADSDSKKQELKRQRKELSLELQSKLFDEYDFLNIQKQKKNVRQVFQDFGRPNLPVGAGECALPKLLQYAFANDLKPLRMAEFWWGKSPKANNRVHGEFYPSCEEKCRPILNYMLKGLK